MRTPEERAKEVVLLWMDRHSIGYQRVIDNLTAHFKECEDAARANIKTRGQIAAEKYISSRGDHCVIIKWMNGNVFGMSLNEAHHPIGAGNPADSLRMAVAAIIDDELRKNELSRTSQAWLMSS